MYEIGDKIRVKSLSDGDEKYYKIGEILTIKNYKSG